MVRRFSIAIMMTMAVVLPDLFIYDANAAIVYSTIGSVYSENFDSLPTDTQTNANIEGIYQEGWRDDTTTVPATRVSVPGWYLYHPLNPANENGFNEHQRFRMGPGANTGAFWGFANSADDPEKALGDVGSTTTASNDANLVIGLRLVNNTGVTLTSFTLTFDGEQWRDGAAPTGETMRFDYSLTATLTDWFSSAAFTPVPSFNFTSPVASDVNTSGTAVNGNIDGLVPGIGGTVHGISWAPGGELWLRWNDPQIASAADDGLAIDNVSFSAVVPEPTSVCLLATSAVAFVPRRPRR